MGKRRLYLVIFAIVVAFVCLGFIGVRSFIQYVYNERSCEWANIDNIEMHAKFDVPETVGDCDCIFDVTSNVKMSVLKLSASVDLKKYLLQQKFISARQQAPQPELYSWRGFPKNSQRLFVRSDNNYDSDYRVALDTTTRKLWVYIRYKR